MLSNGILETTTTTGTGDLTTSAVTGRPRFTDKFTANATEASATHFYYAILTQDNPPQFIESGIGWMSATGTLKRGIILSTYASSTYSDTTATAATLAAGTKNVICTGEVGSAAGLTIPGIDNSNSYLRYAYSAHIGFQQYGATLVTTANRLYQQPFLHLSTRPIDALWVRHSATAGNFRIGLFEYLPTGLPGRRLMGSTADKAGSAGTIVVDTTGGPIRPAPGWYMLCIVTDGITINAASAGWTIMSNPSGHDGTSKTRSCQHLANGSLVIADPASAWATPLTSDTAPLGMGVRYAA